MNSDPTLEILQSDLAAAAKILKAGPDGSGAWLRASNDVLFWSEFGHISIRDQAKALHEKHKHERLKALRLVRQRSRQ